MESSAGSRRDETGLTASPHPLVKVVEWDIFRIKDINIFVGSCDWNHYSRVVERICECGVT